MATETSSPYPCFVCSSKFTSQRVYMEHLQGNTHKTIVDKMLEDLNAIHSAVPGTPLSSSNSQLSLIAGVDYGGCTLCNKIYTSEINKTSHENSSTHKTKYEDYMYCVPCSKGKFSCMSSADAHYASIQHMKRTGIETPAKTPQRSTSPVQFSQASATGSNTPCQSTLSTKRNSPEKQDMCNICNVSYGSPAIKTAHEESKSHKSKYQMFCKTGAVPKHNSSATLSMNAADSSNSSTTNELAMSDKSSNSSQAGNLLLPIMESCIICNKKYDNEMNKLIHENSCSHKMKLQKYMYCESCHQQFETIASREQHYSSSKHYQISGEGIPLPSRAALTDVTASKDIHCELCDAWFSGPGNAKQHYDSDKHKKKVALTNNETSNVIASNTRIDVFCEICQTPFTGSKPAEEHYKSAAHNKKVEKLGNSSNLKVAIPHLQVGVEPCVNSYSSAANLLVSNLYCKPCDKPFSGPQSAQEHYNSVGHNKNMEKLGSLPPNQAVAIPHLQVGLEACVSSNSSARNLLCSNLEDNLYCKTCEKPFTGPQPAEEHYNSAAHKKKVAEMNNSPLNQMALGPSIGLYSALIPSEINSAIHPILVNVTDDTNLKGCEICQTADFNSIKQKEDHMQSFKHEKKKDAMAKS